MMGALMPDKMTVKQRSYTMSRIRSSKTKPELLLKNALKSIGFKYQPKGVYGKPDFANRKEKIAIFVDGCFWHRCPRHYVKPVSNKKYWLSKINGNVKRDRKVNKYLRSHGWRVIRIWEHELYRVRKRNVKS